jgi:hypothetical protein
MYFRSLLYFLKILKGKQKLKTGEQYQDDTRPAGPTEESSWLTHAIRGAAQTRSPGRLTRAVVRSPVANELCNLRSEHRPARGRGWGLTDRLRRRWGGSAAGKWQCSVTAGGGQQCPRVVLQQDAEGKVTGTKKWRKTAGVRRSLDRRSWRQLLASKPTRWGSTAIKPRMGSH